MKILHVVPSYIPAYRYGGTIESVHGLCKGLAESGHEIHVFTTNIDGDKDLNVPLERPIDLDGVKVWYFPLKNPRRLCYSPSMGRALRREVENFDLAHLHSIFLWPTWVAARAARNRSIPYIISPHGMLIKELIRRKSHFAKTAWIHFIEKENLERSAALHMTSQIEADEAARFGFRLPNIFVISNGVNVPPIASGAELPPAVRAIVAKERFILFLGRVNWKKGLDRLIPALSYVPDLRLVIAGNDDENYQPVLEALADRCGVRERLAFTGFVRGAEKAALLGHAAVLVLPSYSENFGIVVLEAMAFGCPVAVTPEVGAAEIVREERAGSILNGDPEELGRGINTMLADPLKLRDMGERGRRAALEKYTWTAAAKRMAEVYESILARGGL